MAKMSLIAFSFLLSTALSAPVKVKEESVTLFHGEDFHIPLSSLGLEVSFLPSPRSPSVLLMQGGAAVGGGGASGRVRLNQHLSHLVVEAVGERDEGVYTLKNPERPEEDRRITLVVRDCSNEQTVLYGESYHIPLLGLTPPISLEYKPISVEANLTSKPGHVLLTSTGRSRDGYQGRISVSERYVSLHGVTGADEGSYTVRDAQGAIQRKVCLQVREHQNFAKLPLGKRLKINLILNSSLVSLYYSPNYDHKPRMLLDKGEFTSAVKELNLEERLSIEGSMVFLDQVKNSDSGQFSVTDILGFTVSITHLELQPYKLEALYVAIIALLGLVVFLLLVCLLSCLIKVKKRAKRAAALEKLAKNAGSEEEGEAFRQVVKNITKLSEESKHSQADNTEKSQSTEVDIKGLEVSSKEVGIGNLETSDSGVGFNTALPLDTDTDAPDQLSESLAITTSVAAPVTKASPPAAPECKPSAPPAIEIKSSPVAETKTCPTPETKKTPDQPVIEKLDVSKPADVKVSPATSPGLKLSPSPADPKPAPSPSPEPKQADLKPAPTPSPEPKPVDLKPALSLSPEPKAADPKPAPTPSPEPKAADPKPAPTPSPEPKPVDLKPALSLSPEPKAADPKPAPTPSPEPKPVDPKPAPTPSPEPKAVTPKVPSPMPESKSALTPTPGSPKPTTPEPITNGTPEPGPDSKPSPDHADTIEASAPAAAPPKTPDVELKAGGVAAEASKGAKAEDSTATT